MIDVHDAHHAATTWREFLIHIATIVLGLLIAIGLEQTVEYFHHRHQLEVARRELSVEREENRRILQQNLDSVKSMEVQLDQDMALLLKHRSSNAPIGGKLVYPQHLYRTPSGVWQSVQQSGALDLMPHVELKNNTYLYQVLSSFMEAVHAFYIPSEVADAIAHRSPDGNLSPHDTDELITATSEAQGKLSYAAKFLGFEATGLEKAGR